MKHRFGFLSDTDSPLLPYWLYEARKAGVEDIAVICDSLKTKEKDLRIWQERTRGQFCALDGTQITISEIDGHFGTRTPYFMVANHNSSELVTLCRALGITCLFNAGTPRKLTAMIISATPNGVVNIHPGILPKYRGASAVEWALLHGDRVGNSAHFMDEGYDTGPIIEIDSYDFSPPFLHWKIRTEVYQRGCVLAGRILKDIEAGKINLVDARPQHLDEGRQWPPMPDSEFETLLKLLDGPYPYPSS